MDSMTKIIKGVPFIASSTPSSHYIVAIVEPQNRDTVITEDDIETVRQYKKYIINQFATAVEKRNFEEDPEYNALGINGYIFVNNDDAGWCYHKTSWENPLQLFPSIGSDYNFKTAQQLIDFIEKDNPTWRKR